MRPGAKSSSRAALPHPAQLIRSWYDGQCVGQRTTCGEKCQPRRRRKKRRACLHHALEHSSGGSRRETDRGRRSQRDQHLPDDQRRRQTAPTQEINQRQQKQPGSGGEHQGRAVPRLLTAHRRTSQRASPSAVVELRHYEYGGGKNEQHQGALARRSRAPLSRRAPAGSRSRGAGRPTPGGCRGRRRAAPRSARRGRRRRSPR